MRYPKVLQNFEIQSVFFVPEVQFLAEDFVREATFSSFTSILTDACRALWFSEDRGIDNVSIIFKSHRLPESTPGKSL